MRGIKKGDVEFSPENMLSGALTPKINIWSDHLFKVVLSACRKIEENWVSEANLNPQISSQSCEVNVRIFARWSKAVIRV